MELDLTVAILLNLRSQTSMASLTAYTEQSSSLLLLYYSRNTVLHMAKPPSTLNTTTTCQDVCMRSLTSLSLSVPESPTPKWWWGGPKQAKGEPMWATYVAFGRTTCPAAYLCIFRLTLEAARRGGGGEN